MPRGQDQESDKEARIERYVLVGPVGKRKKVVAKREKKNNGRTKTKDQMYALLNPS